MSLDNPDGSYSARGVGCYENYYSDLTALHVMSDTDLEEVRYDYHHRPGLELTIMFVLPDKKRPLGPTATTATQWSWRRSCWSG